MWGKKQKGRRNKKRCIIAIQRHLRTVGTGIKMNIVRILWGYQYYQKMTAFDLSFLNSPGNCRVKKGCTERETIPSWQGGEKLFDAFVYLTLDTMLGGCGGSFWRIGPKRTLTHHIARMHKKHAIIFKRLQTGESLHAKPSEEGEGGRIKLDFLKSLMRELYWD